MTDIKKIAVLLRVYSRIDDLLANLTIIRKRWSIGDRAYVLVSSNGSRDGFHLPEEVYRLSDVVVELDENLGHIRGNAQLILKGLEKIPDETDFLIILEADTWLLNDEIIKKYINIMSEEKIVWCSSEWS
ncbi:MAG: hypothetical protein N3C60_03585, partial [Calditerrivibrio sp.]|nr:hypothetical protein [Calditerrivibrio sp.]